MSKKIKQEVRQVESDLFGHKVCQECKLTFNYWDMHEKHYTLCITCGDIKEIKSGNTENK